MPIIIIILTYSSPKSISLMKQQLSISIQEDGKNKGKATIIGTSGTTFPHTPVGTRTV